MAASESTAGQLVSDEEFQVLDLGAGLSESKSEPNPAGNSIQTQPDPASKTLKSQDSPACALPRCDCHSCKLVKQFLKQYEVQTHKTEPETPNSSKNSAFLCVWLLSCCRILGGSFSTAKTLLSDILQRRKGPEPPRSSLKIPLKMLAGLSIVLLVVLASLGLRSAFSPKGLSCPDDSSAKVHKLERIVQDYEQKIVSLEHMVKIGRDRLQRREAELEELRRYTNHRYELEKTAQDSVLTNEKILKFAGMTNQKLAGELGLSLTYCELPSLDFRYKGKTDIGSYQGECVGRTPHGSGQISTFKGLRILGTFRGGQLHGIARIFFEEERSHIEYVHGVEHGFFHFLAPEVKIGYVQDDQAVGPQLWINSAGKIVYFVSGIENNSNNVPSIIVSADQSIIKLKTSNGSGTEVSRLFTPSDKDELELINHSNQPNSHPPSHIDHQSQDSASKTEDPPSQATTTATEFADSTDQEWIPDCFDG